MSAPMRMPGQESALPSSGQPIVINNYPVSNNFGTQAEFDTYFADLPAGAEYVWQITDGAGNILGTLTGVK